jgi:hypothetical protein
MKIQKRTLYPEARIKPVSSPNAVHLLHHQRRLQAAGYEVQSTAIEVRSLQPYLPYLPEFDCKGHAQAIYSRISFL